MARLNGLALDSKFMKLMPSIEECGSKSMEIYVERHTGFREGA
jgi:hypothetical protein